MGYHQFDYCMESTAAWWVHRTRSLRFDPNETYGLPGQGCSVLAAFSTNSLSWGTSCMLGIIAWYIAVNRTNSKIYVTDHLLPANSVYVNMTSGSCNFVPITSQPTIYKNSLGIA